MEMVSCPMGEKAQITLPKVVRKALGLKKKGELVGFMVESGSIRLTKARVIPEASLSDREIERLAVSAGRHHGKRRFRDQKTFLRHLWSL